MNNTNSKHSMITRSQSKKSKESKQLKPKKVTFKHTNGVVLRKEEISDDIPMQLVRRPHFICKVKRSQPLAKFNKNVYSDYYTGQQVCVVRDTDYEDYYYDALYNHRDNLDTYLQHMYDAGCELMRSNIILKKDNGFELNKNFGDISSWKFAENNVINNCLLFKKLGHSLYQ